MDIEDAFTVDAIDMTDTNVGGDEETELRRVVKEIHEANQFDTISLGVLCFVAGRAYQSDSAITHIPIPLEMVTPFMEFLAQRGET